MKKRMSDLETINSELVKISARESQYRKAILYDAIFFFEIDLTRDRFIPGRPGAPFLEKFLP